MGKAIAREFLWFLLIVILAFPCALLYLRFLGYSPEVVDLSLEEESYILQTILIGYIVSFVCLYLMRFLIGALRALAKPPEEEGAEEMP